MANRRPWRAAHAFAIRAGAALALCLALGAVVDAQLPRAVLTVEARIYLYPDPTRTPLTTLPRGTTVFVRKSEGEWTEIEFRDRYFGPRVGWVSSAALEGLPRPDQAPPQPPAQSVDSPAPKAPDSSAPPAEHQHGSPAASDDHAHHVTSSHPDDALPSARDGSGTSWLPDITPMYGLHRNVGGWNVMTHGNAFAQYLFDDGARGSEQFGSVNWLMAMLQRQTARSRFGVRGMFSFERWTIGGCGYPDLLATGERCDGEPIHDRQHQHDVFMELAAEFDHRLAGSVHMQVYGGVVGEPALGPVAYPHRVTAMPNPLAPISHHWLDATHITFGVVTAGLYGARWKTEASVFNGREPDEDRTDLDMARLDSYSGRVWLMPTPTLALQVSAGHLKAAEMDDGGERVDVDRVTASATYHRPLENQGIWGTTVAWGRNRHEGDSSDALLLETILMLRNRDTLFARFELVGKTGHDLGIEDDEETLFRVSKGQAGYVRYLPPLWGLQAGLGGSASISVVPQSLKSVYSRRANAGLAGFLTVRPAGHKM